MLIDEVRPLNDKYLSIRSDNGFISTISSEFFLKKTSNSDTANLLNILKSEFPIDVQSVILRQTVSFKSWLTAKMFCKEQAVSLYSEKALKELKISHQPNKATEAFLRHKFKQIVQNNENSGQVNYILSKYSAETNPLPQSASRFQSIVQKVTKVTSMILAVISFPLSLYCGCRIGCYYYEVVDNVINYTFVHVVLNKVINHAPVELIRLASTIYDFRLIFTIAFLVTSFTRLNNYSFIRIPLYALNELMAISLKIPLKIAYYFYSISRNVTKEGASFIGEKSGIYERIFRSCQFEDAENLWVHQVMNLKVQESRV